MSKLREKLAERIREVGFICKASDIVYQPAFNLGGDECCQWSAYVKIAGSDLTWILDSDDTMADCARYGIEELHERGHCGGPISVGARLNICGKLCGGKRYKDPPRKKPAEWDGEITCPACMRTHEYHSSVRDFGNFDRRFDKVKLVHGLTGNTPKEFEEIRKPTDTARGGDGVGVGK